MASKRRIRRKKCDGKRKYASQEDALKVSASMQRKEKTLWCMQAYRCSFCKQFHLGHPRKGRQIRFGLTYLNNA